MTTAMDTRTAYELLGSMLLEEIVVQAGIRQARDPGGDPVRVSLDFTVTVDPVSDRLLVHGERLGKPPLQIGFDVSSHEG